jgi:SRSO17 transposase
LGELFGRAEPRRQVGLYFEGLLSAVERKNGWQLAEHLGDARPWRTQRLLSHVQWDEVGRGGGARPVSSVRCRGLG